MVKLATLSISMLVLIIGYYEIHPTASVSDNYSGSGVGSVSRLLPFGTGTDDMLGPTDDNGASDPLIPSVPFSFFGRQYRDIIVNSNGVLSFGAAFTAPQPTTFPFISRPLIVPFWSDFDPSTGGSIFYRQTSELENLFPLYELLAILQSDVEELIDFIPTHMLVATWHQVSRSQGLREVNNTFQAIIARDFTKTLAFFIYDDINWGKGAQIGFNIGDGSSFYMLPEAFSDETLNISQITNAGIPGYFVYRIDRPRPPTVSITSNTSSPIVISGTSLQLTCHIQFNPIFFNETMPVSVSTFWIGPDGSRLITAMPPIAVSQRAYISTVIFSPVELKHSGEYVCNTVTNASVLSVLATISITVDIDECSSEDLNYCDQMCINTAGSYHCSCLSGYFLDPTNNATCLDTDECLVEHHNCTHICNNTEGSFNCSCADGYFLDPTDRATCRDIDECSSADLNLCTQLCNNTEGSYLCHCTTGYSLDLTDGVTCLDVDECVDNEDICPPHSDCINTRGSYHCQCSSLFEVQGDGSEMNECQLSATFVIGSILGVVVFFLLIGTLPVLVCICCCISYSIGRHKSRSIRLNQSHFQDGEVHEFSEFSCPASSRGFSVQSSFKHTLPPHLIINAENIKLLEPIGQGEFGIVYKAQVNKRIGQIVHNEVVAVKTLKGFYDRSSVKDMLKECSKMYKFEHPNVLTLTGVCFDGGTAPYIIMPFMANGSLLTYLKNSRKHVVIYQADKDDAEVEIAHRTLTDMCIQIAKGMEYLASMKVVHRDLAARNCMIDVNFVIKVADFGLSETVSETKLYFRQDQTAIMKLPLKWLAPESMEDHVFCEKSDVWAYGVTCWEIFSGGKVPYPSVNLTDLSRLLAEGHRLDKPLNDACTEDMYKIMIQCWEFEPEMRPTFSSIVELLSSLLEAAADYMETDPSSRKSTECSDESTLGALILENTNNNFLEVVMEK